ncbi:hypothetical protein Acr_13g0001280 [Actinidia rufa]|uniref:Uncharacterized protein n=1 Tax=Actinidia rufa TaxID=165716 RepID=A0A7J0FLD0_9ERIC|nr:hypothetical protein Acr_13g0001280 [Actinidia rufa]
MASTEELRRRTKDEPTVEPTQNNDNNYNNRGRRRERTAMARRGLRSLAIAVLAPLSLHVAAITFSHSSHGASTKPPPPWTLHAICVGPELPHGLLRLARVGRRAGSTGSPLVWPSSWAISPRV